MSEYNNEQEYHDGIILRLARIEAEVLEIKRMIQLLPELIYYRKEKK